jgi:hypothetical protein
MFHTIKSSFDSETPESSDNTKEKPTIGTQLSLSDDPNKIFSLIDVFSGDHQ